MRMSLNKTWTECLRMWKWIVKYLEDSHNPSLPVWKLKDMWLIANNYELNKIYNDCFFCDYAKKAKNGGRLFISVFDDDNNYVYCPDCPACKIDKTFCCEDKFDWQEGPIEFYKELVRLNKIRLSKKGK